ncbi:hypothetical protein NI813_26225 [Escherichia coli]|uniref:hypothetical protein n=1 Tax=Escherichia coli TaxID=562 RepID=UPI00209AD10B|nr:hypothetical protein [Escherichia coli]MCO7847358.1 hypothetical protein [Escherichia coli]MCO7852658.1 hypothetical protein [Escherichia coli]MCO7867808.1 hypothetical protein [Escherichia coli]
MTSLKTSIKTITYLSDIGCLEIQGASLVPHSLAVMQISADQALETASKMLMADVQEVRP